MIHPIYPNTSSGTPKEPLLDFQLNLPVTGSNPATPFPPGTDQPPKPQVFQDYRQLSSR